MKVVPFTECENLYILNRVDYCFVNSKSQGASISNELGEQYTSR